MSYASEKVRFIKLQVEAMATAARQRADILPNDFRMSQLTTQSDYEWHTQWKPISTRKGAAGGWNWPDLRAHYQRKATNLTVAMWTGPRPTLNGMFLGRLNRSAATIDYLEGSPDVNHILKGKVVLVALEVVTVYARITGRRYVWLVNPISELKDLYTKQYGFEYVEPRKGSPFCRREV
jgi:hypothetical protein